MAPMPIWFGQAFKCEMLTVFQGVDEDFEDPEELQQQLEERLRLEQELRDVEAEVGSKPLQEHSPLRSVTPTKVDNGRFSVSLEDYQALHDKLKQFAHEIVMLSRERDDFERQLNEAQGKPQRSPLTPCLPNFLMIYL